MQWLTDNGSAYTAHETRRFARELNLEPCTTAVSSPQSNGMAERFVKTMREDYIAFMPKPDVRTALRNLAAAFTHYNENHPHSALAFNQRIMQGEASLSTLSQPEFYDPEIVFFADKLDAYTDQPEFRMISPDGTTFVTRFYSAELNYVTRWILYNGEQQVAAFALPATCRPEGYLAAQRNGTLIQVAPQQTRTFTVTTGIA